MLLLAFSNGSASKESACKAKDTGVWSLGQENPLEEEMTTHSSVLVCKTPWTEEPGGLQSMGRQRVGHSWTIKHMVVVFSCSVVSDSLQPKDCSPPGSSVPEISQARILEHIALLQGSSQPRDWTRVFCIAGRFFTTEPPEKSLYFNFLKKKGIYFCDLKSSHFIACYFFLPPLISFFSQVFIESLFCGRQVLGVQWWYTDLTLSSQILDEWGRPVSKYSRAGCLKIQC